MTRIRMHAGAWVIAAVLATGAPANAAGPVGRIAPDCTFSLAGGGRAVSLRALRGKVVYLDFWASWCAPCAVSFPFMSQLSRANRAKGLELLAVNLDREPREAAAFLARRPPEFDVALGDNRGCARAFGVESMPQSYLIDRSGVVRWTHAGFRAAETSEVGTAVERALAPAVSP